MELGDLAHNPENPRVITEDKLKLLKKSLAEYGDLSGFIFNRTTGRLVGGHQRSKVLPSNAKIHYTKKNTNPSKVGTLAVGFIEVDGEKFSYREVAWDDLKEKAANIAANKGAGEWDATKLTEWFSDLKTFGFDMDLTMFDNLERKSYIEDEPVKGKIDDDAVPEVPQNVHGVKTGDVWILGEHRLLCGDSTSKADVEKLMAGEKADMVFTDPPYGIAYKGGSKERDEIENDAVDVLPFYRAFLSLAKEHSTPGAAIYVWHAPSETHNCINAALESGWLFKSYLIWVKNNSTFGRSDYHWQHEPAFYGWGADGTHDWYGDRKQTTTWMIDRPSRSNEHPTMKPVELCEKGITNSSPRSGLVYEPFCGSGSTLIACEKTNRKCYGIEIDPHYCSVIIERWQQFTGKKAILQKPKVIKRER